MQTVRGRKYTFLFSFSPIACPPLFFTPFSINLPSTADGSFYCPSLPFCRPFAAPFRGMLPFILSLFHPVRPVSRPPLFRPAPRGQYKARYPVSYDSRQPDNIRTKPIEPSRMKAGLPTVKTFSHNHLINRNQLFRHYLCKLGNCG